MLFNVSCHPAFPLLSQPELYLANIHEGFNITQLEMNFHFNDTGSLGKCPESFAYRTLHSDFADYYSLLMAFVQIQF